MATSLPSTMRAAAWTSTSGGLPKNIHLTSTAPLPKTAKSLSPGSTLVKVSFASLNPVDFKVPEAPIVGRTLLAKGIPASDFSGTVVQTTPETGLEAGDQVFGFTALPAFGACAEYLVAPKANVIKVPSGVSLETAATLGIAGLTAYQTLAPFVKSGDKVFINAGSGGVGTYQIQIAKALGCHVTVSCSGTNAKFCKSLGADQVIDYKTQDVLVTLSQSGTQYDHFVDNVFSSSALFFSAQKFLSPAGKYVTIAGAPQLSVIRDILSASLWPGVLGGGKRKFVFVTCTASVEESERVAKMVQEGKVKVQIEKIYELGETGSAYERLKSGRTRGKLVVRVA